MPNLIDGTANVTVTKQNGTKVHIGTKDKFVNTDIDVNINVQQAQTSGGSIHLSVSPDGSTPASTDATNATDEIFGIASSTEPASGYYALVKAAATGGASIETPGWINPGDIQELTENSESYLTLKEATEEISATNEVSPYVSTSGRNVILSDVDNGVQVTSVGGGSATANITVSGVTGGYVPSGTEIGTGVADAPNKTISQTRYIAGVNLPSSSGQTNTFTVTVPNGETTQTFTFSVDSDGNVTIT